MLSSVSNVLQKSQLTGILEYICQGLELTQAQFNDAQDKYQRVGCWLNEPAAHILSKATIYPQGSLSLQTTVRPLFTNEYDVDLVCHVPGITIDMAPSQLKKLIGDRLKQNALYKDRLEEKSRCWRLNYADEFHMDITPSIANPYCSQGGELVPDKSLQAWKPSNPKGYNTSFNQRALMQPKLLLAESKFAEVRAQVEALPLPTKFKGILRRTIQLCKRHRDVMFCETAPHLAPISVIITTLAALSYEYCVQKNIYETEIDVFLSVVKHMPSFIEKKQVAGKQQYFIWNETTLGENFAEKWNADSDLADAFYSWHAKAVTDFTRISKQRGLDLIQQDLSLSLGKKVVSDAMMLPIEKIGAARKDRSLIIMPHVGLTVGLTKGTGIRANTFFGK
jgi:hypothetical protein